MVRAGLQLLLLLALACTSDPLPEIRARQAAGDFEETIASLWEILDEDPSQTEAALLLGKALLHTGNAGLAVWPLRNAAGTPEVAVEAGVLLTRAMLESRSALDAVEQIERVLEIEPDNREAPLLLVSANRSTRRIEESLADIDRVLELQPTNLAVLVTRVTALIALDRIEEAGVSLDVAQASFAVSDAASRLLARLCAASASFTFHIGEIQEAEKQYASCAERFPTEKVAVAGIVAFYDRIQNSERGTEILERAANESKAVHFHTILAQRMIALGTMEAEERLLSEKAESRNSTPAWFALADYYVQREFFHKAIDAFESALSLSPGSPRLGFAYADTLVQAEQFEKAREAANQLEQPEFRNLILGRIFLAEGRARDALGAFETGIQLWPSNAVGRFLAGQAAEGVGDFEKAVSFYRESFRTSPGASEAGLALAELNLSRGSHERALQIASSYLKIPAHNNNAKALLLRIRIAHALDRSKLVKEGLERLSKMPGQAAVVTAQRASFLAEAGATEQAVEVVEAAGLDLTDASNSIAFRVLIEQFEVLGQHGKAARLVDAAVAAHPEDSVFRELQGDARKAATQPDSARASYERALELEAKSWRALAGLAALAAAAGDTIRALELYDRALAAGPEDSTIAFAAVAIVRETDPQQAALRLERLLDAHPRAASAANELAGILAARGELDRASVFASRAAWFNFPGAGKTSERIRKFRAERANRDLTLRLAPKHRRTTIAENYLLTEPQGLSSPL